MNRHSRSIVLVGMMGAGKSSVGVCLRRRTRLKLFDTDEIVTSKFGMPISKIFSEYGENKFREAETEALQTLATSEPVVIVTGGGIVLREENIHLLKRLGVVVWLEANESEALRERMVEDEDVDVVKIEAKAQLKICRLPSECAVIDDTETGADG